jgi:hypothetical protein
VDVDTDKIATMKGEEDGWLDHGSNVCLLSTCPV